MKIYAISGLGADERCFQFLELKEHTIVPVNWIRPLAKENIQQYALRLAQKHEIHLEQEAFVIMGLSFGGIVAAEIARIYPPQKCIIISSILSHHELHWFYHFIAKIQILKYLPPFFFNPSFWMIQLLFKAKNKALLKAIIKDADPRFNKWAVNNLILWRGKNNFKPVLRIHGLQDSLLPCPPQSALTHTLDGGHFIIVDKASLINPLISHFLAS